MGERVGVRVPSGPRFGVDGAFEGYVRLPFTVGGAVAEEAAARLAAAARLVENGVSGGGGESPRTFVA
jgi:bifunctional pyridoxal-dependent enzyme with beta-cystathionase and maltose regulon repressor activities